MYSIDFSDRALADITFFKKNDPNNLKKIDKLLTEIENHPETGTGKPERLRHRNGNQWSRRITEKHRLVYEIFEEIVVVKVIRAYGHYDDK